MTSKYLQSFLHLACIRSSQVCVGDYMHIFVMANSKSQQFLVTRSRSLPKSQDK